MFLVKLILSFFIIIINFTSFNTLSTTKVSIYYESLCPDSVRFIKNQLYPNFQGLKDRIDIDFVPYGKAIQWKTQNGRWKFDCQHGNDECLGNKYQACILNQKKGQINDVNVINCIMSLSDPSDVDGIEECVNDNDYNWKDVINCYKTIGDQLLANYGDRTHNVEPKITFIPTIIYNGTFNQHNQDKSIHYFLNTMCSLITDPKPNVCYNSLPN